MYGNPQMESSSKSRMPHKFFERSINNDLSQLSSFLLQRYKEIEEGVRLKGERNKETLWDDSQSESTRQWDKYNVFQFHSVEIFNLFRSLREMTIEACDYYKIDFHAQNFIVQGWFNINYAKKGKLDWHEHGGDGAPFFHGYYCVSAQPSNTHYRVFDKEVTNVNKNNRAILSETGHPHAMADWDWDGPRITIAYDVVPLEYVRENWQQHWVPMP